jgi:D-cysteine desulfhydrase family pyridoxal phosphate-dependent enzyme
MALIVSPRVRLAHAPTPLESMPYLSAALVGPELYVKRDDCTGLAMGGNKARQLEYYLGQAVDQNADTILITGAVQSNFVRQAAAAARKCGMDCHIQLEDRVPHNDATYLGSGNVLLDHLLGATIHEFSEGEDEAAADANLEAIADGLREQGRKPYVIHLGIEHPPWGGLGYVDAGRETAAQAKAMNQKFDAVVIATGSGLTHAGMLAGLRAAGDRTPIYGICVRRDAKSQQARIERRLKEILALAGLPSDTVAAGEVRVEDTWLGPGYGHLTDEISEAMHLAAETEALILDPVYTGKVMAGLIGMVRRGDFKSTDKVLFVHTGGSPALFGYEELNRAIS